MISLFDSESCYLCGISFGMPSEFKASRLSDKKTFYCPNGHAQHYVGETDRDRADRLNRRLTEEREEKNRLEKKVDQLRCNLRRKQALKTKEKRELEAVKS